MRRTEEIQLGNTSAMQALDALIAKARQLRQELNSVSTALGQNPSAEGVAHIFETAQHLSGVNAAIAGIQSSTNVGSGAVMQTAMQAVAGGAASSRGIRLDKGIDAGSVLGMIASTGIHGSSLGNVASLLSNGVPTYTSGQSAADVVQQVINSTRPGPSSLIGQNRYDAQLASSAGVMNSFAGFMRNFGGFVDRTNVNNFMAQPMPAMNWQPGDFNDYGSYALASGQFTPQQITAGRTAMMYGTGYGMLMATNAYTNAITSGQPQPMAFGNAYGSMAGTGIGMAIAAGMGVGPIGIGAAALFGSQFGGSLVNAFQAPWQARYQAAGTLSAYAAMAGANPMDAAASAENIAYNANTAFTYSGGYSLRGYGDFMLRVFGLYQGIDQTSTQDAAKVYSTLGGAYAQSGDLVPDAALRSRTDRFLKRYKKFAPEVADAYARAQSSMAAVNGNITDLTQAAGIVPSLTFLRDNGYKLDYDSLVSHFATAQTLAYRSGQAQADIGIAGAGYERSAFSGRSTRERSLEFAGSISAMQEYAGSLQAEISNIEGMPGGRDSALARTKRALLAAAARDIEAAYNERSRSIVADITTAAQTRLVGVQTQSVTASLYGGPGDFANVARGQMAALGQEADQLRGMLSDPHLDYQTRHQIQQRLSAIHQARIQAPANAAVASFGRTVLYGDVRQTYGNYGISYATNFGSDADLGNAVGNSIAGRNQTINELQQQLNNPHLPVEQRAQAMMAMMQQYQGIMNDQISARDTLLNRIGARSNIAETTANFGVNKSFRIGTGDDVRNSSKNAFNALEDEKRNLQYQLDSGGLTEDQKLRIKQRMAQIPGEEFNMQQDAIDEAYKKDDISGYGLRALKLSGARRRMMMLPFMPGDLLRNSVASIQNDYGQLNVLKAREAELRRGGNLSPERMYEIEQQRQGLLDDVASGISSLAEGGENRLLAMSAGRPALWRGDSLQLAAMNVFRIGAPIKRYGAVNGQHLAQQDAFYHALGATGPGMSAPFSNSSEVNAPREIVTLLQQIRDALTHGSGKGAFGSTRPGEAAGYANAYFATRDLGRRDLNNSAN